jgi:hypothetical protein
MSEQYLAGIVERASTLDERLGGDFVSAEGEDTGLVDARLEAWSWALGKGDRDRFRRRLAWDGLDPEAVRPVLGRVRTAGRIDGGATLRDPPQFGARPNATERSRQCRARFIERADFSGYGHENPATLVHQTAS